MNSEFSDWDTIHHDTSCSCWSSSLNLPKSPSSSSTIWSQFSTCGRISWPFFSSSRVFESQFFDSILFNQQFRNFRQNSCCNARNTFHVLEFFVCDHTAQDENNELMNYSQQYTLS
ncbi:uncharacterized protein DS421_6g190020 [Arachis hypogaea]|nr:uncharacterized protein DS421_6g190020 [Arachis hypogaea]